MQALSPSELLALHQSQRAFAGDARDAVEWAVCGRCGGPFTKGTGRYLAPFDVHRECLALSSGASRVIAAAAHLLGVDLSRSDAHVVAGAVNIAAYMDVPGAEPVHVRGRLPRRWGHVDRKALRRAVENLGVLREEAGLDPTSCSAGPCCWCAVREAVGWTDVDIRWGNGEPAPLCSGCAAAFLRYCADSAAYLSEQRDAAWSALTGKPLLMGHGAPEGFRLWAEIAPEGHSGHDEPWGFIPPEQRPGTAEHAALVESQRQAARQRREAEQAERLAAERAEAERWGRT